MEPHSADVDHDSVVIFDIIINSRSSIALASYRI